MPPRPPRSRPATLPDRDAALASGGAKRKRGPKSALSLDAFARAKRSTYDKRAVLEKRRNLMAGKVNKYRKVQKRLGDSVEVDDAFDPEKYAARLEAFEAAELPKDDGWGRGKHGRLPPTDAVPTPSRRRDIADHAAAAAAADDDDDDAAPSDSDDEFADNVVDRADAGEGETGVDRGVGGAKPGAPNGKGWNKTVKDRLRWEKEKAAKAEEMRELRAKWAEEDAARKAFYDKRNDRRGKFRKKNARGQPVMKHRVDKILEQLQAGGA